MFGSQDQNEEIQPLTPNMLLIGRSDMDSKSPEYDLDISLPKRSAYVQNLVDKWWSLWIKQVWPHLVPCKKWRSVSRNLAVGDVCLLSFPGALTGKFKLVRVVEIHPDGNGIVRTVSINIRKSNTREKPTEFFKNSMIKEKVGIQRLIVIQPADDPEKQPDESLSSHVPGKPHVHPRSSALPPHDQRVGTPLAARDTVDTPDQT